jgi:predicted Zn-ribbon and HTH transcriptional regulator
MRHIVDNETAVTDITDVFVGDGERLLDLLLERQSNESAEAFQELAKKRQDLLNELSNTSKSLKALRKQVRALD